MERHTFQKECVICALRELDHPTAEEVFHLVRERCSSISKATVYRILSQMAQKGEVLRLFAPTGADVFDTSLFHHCHIICRKCGRVFDVGCPDPTLLQQQLRFPDGFVVEQSNFVFQGVCPCCNELKHATEE